MKNTAYHIDLWEERQMEYGIGIVRLCDIYWWPERIKKSVSNWRMMEKLKGINGLHVIKRMDGSYYLNSISGYTYDKGMYLYMVHPDGTLTREI